MDTSSQVLGEGLGKRQGRGCRRFVREDDVDFERRKRKARAGLQGYCFARNVLNCVAELFVHGPTIQCVYCSNRHKQRINAPLERHKPLRPEKTALAPNHSAGIYLWTDIVSLTKITPPVGSLMCPRSNQAGAYV